MPVTHVQPPKQVARPVKVFLAGTIDNGNSENWQKDVVAELTEYLSDYRKVPVELYNPRRDNWSELDQAALEYQICWELDHIKSSDIVFLWFAENSLSPISLLELGLCLGSNKEVVVGVHPDYFRHTNVEITCATYGKLVYSSLEDAVGYLKNRIAILCAHRTA